jgi:lipoyl(octanoyl) transferase
MTVPDTLEIVRETAQVPYRPALEAMAARNAAIADGTAAELIWLLEHPPVYTAGTSADRAELLDPRFEVVEAGRGGRYTYHGPGQRIGYVLLDLRQRARRCARLRPCGGRLGDRHAGRFRRGGLARRGRIGIWCAGPTGARPRSARSACASAAG